MLNIDLKDRVVIVTGGSEGIGAAIAKTLAKFGAKVAMFSRDEEEMQMVVDEIQRGHGQAMWAKTDVTNSDEVVEGVRKVLKVWGQIDGLFANAGINGTWAPIETLSPDEWRQTIDVNLTGTYLAIHHTVPNLKAQDSKGWGGVL